MKTNVILKAAVASALGFAALTASAANLTISGTPTAFAVENFPAADTIIGPTITLTAAGTDVVAGNTISLTLDNGTWSPTSVPVAVKGGATLAVGTGVLSNNNKTVTYTVTATSTAADTLTITTPVITDVGSTLADPTKSAKITLTTSGAATPTGSPFTTATSASAFTSTINNTGSNDTVDIQNGGKALAWRVGSANQSFATLGTFTVAASAGKKDIGGSVDFTTSASDSIKAVISGNVNGSLSSLYLSTSACSATVPATLTATISGTTATITGLALGTSYNVCAVANGTNILGAGQVTGVTQIAYGARTVGTTTYTPSGATYTPANMSLQAYNGAVGATTPNYVVGGSGYVSYVRVTNNASTATTVFVSGVKDDGTSYFGTLDSALAGRNSKLYTAADLNTAFGSTVLATGSDRVRLTILTSTTTAPTVSNLMFNPNGTVVNIQ